MSDVIRVLHVFGGLNRGGAETMIMNRYRTIDRSRVQFDFIIHENEKQPFSDEIEALGGRIFSFPRFVGKNYFSIRRCWIKFFKEHPEYKILHSHVRSYASVYIPIAKKFGVKTIIHSHSTSNGKGIRAVAKRMLQYPLRFQADRFMGCSDESGRWLFGNRVVNGKRYVTLHNAIDVEKFSYNESLRLEYRRTLGLEGKTVYVHVGRLHPAKNHEFLIDLFARIHKKHPESVLLCVGDGELRSEIEERIEGYGIGSSVIMMGIRDDVDCILSCADVFLFPSRWEGVPLSVVEAQASGLPCYVSDRVTDDVCVSSLAVRLPIDQGAEAWERAIESSRLVRADASEEISFAGYDVRKNTEWLENYYIELAERT